VLPPSTGRYIPEDKSELDKIFVPLATQKVSSAENPKIIIFYLVFANDEIACIRRVTLK
jgi:hypothetical protein